MVFATKAKEEFNVNNITSQSMEAFIKSCAEIYHGRPSWINDKKSNIKTVNFAKFICSETAKLSTLGMSIVLDGDSERIKNIQKQIDDAKENIRQWIEYAGAYGTIILKPNGKSIDVMLPESFIVTEVKNGRITGVVFINKSASDDYKIFYTRLEYHRFIDGIYMVTNKCYKSNSYNDIGTAIDIEKSPWNGMTEDTAIENLDSPLYGVLKMPGGNSIDIESPLGTAIFADALEELKDLDVAYSRNAEEIFDSERIVLLDSDRMVPTKGSLLGQVGAWERTKAEMKLPKYVRNVMGDGANTFYEEINPALNTEKRLVGINSILSQIGFKCGFSNGYFVFNQSTGFTTATQVTADQARTIQLIEDIRKMVDYCLIDVIKAVNVFEDLYGTTGHVDILDTVSTPELDRMIHIHFEPIYTNKEEDRLRALQLTNSGYYPKWYYLHMYEGMSEEDARALTEEAMPKETGLFAE